MKRLIVLTCLVGFGLAACGGGSSSRPAATTASACSCADYNPKRPRPAWVDADGVDNGQYRSQGLSECTGIKSMDYEEAETQARASLGRMLSSQVKSEITIIRRDFGAEAGGSTDAQVQSDHISKALLEGSSIYDRWVDPGSCTIYAAVRVSVASVKQTLAKQAEEERKRFRNQMFSVAGQGDSSDLIKVKLTQSLVDAGVSRVSQDGNAPYVFSGEIVDSSVINNGKLVRVTLRLSISDNNSQMIWSHQVEGKGVSFGATPTDVLHKKAMESALANVADVLKEMMNKPIDKLSQ